MCDMNSYRREKHDDSADRERESEEERMERPTFTLFTAYTSTQRRLHDTVVACQGICNRAHRLVCSAIFSCLLVLVRGAQSATVAPFIVLKDIFVIFMHCTTDCSPNIDWSPE